MRAHIDACHADRILRLRQYLRQSMWSKKVITVRNVYGEREKKNEDIILRHDLITFSGFVYTKSHFQKVYLIESCFN